MSENEGFVKFLHCYPQKDDLVKINFRKPARRRIVHANLLEEEDILIVEEVSQTAIDGTIRVFNPRNGKRFGLFLSETLIVSRSDRL